VLSSILPKLKVVENTDTHGIFVAEPLETTYGTTLGNSLRRALLSALPGVAITGIKVKGVLHEFSTLKGMKEDVLDFVLNIKQLRVKKLQDFDKEVVLKLEKKGEGNVTGADVKCPPQVEIVNKDLYLSKLIDKKAAIEVELIVEEGRGYLTTEEQHLSKRKFVELIPLDASFSPILRVNFQVSPTRVGQKTNFDKLQIEIFTDGSLKPLDAMNMAAAILVEHFSLFVDEDNYRPEIIKLAEMEAAEEEEAAAAEPVHIANSNDMTIEDLGLTTRVLNSLHAANITTVSQLLGYSKADLRGLRNFGQKSLTEIDERLKEHQLSLKPDEEN